MSRKSLVSAARSLDQQQRQQRHHSSNQVLDFLRNDDIVTHSATFDDIAYAAGILLDPCGSSQSGRALLMERKPLLQSQHQTHVIEWDLEGDDNNSMHNQQKLEKEMEQEKEQSLLISTDAVTEIDESHIENYPRVVEAWLLSIAVRYLHKEAKYTEALSLCSKSIGIVSDHVHIIETMSPTSPLNRSSNEEQRTSLLLLHYRLQKLRSSMAKECVKATLHESSDGKKVTRGRDGYSHSRLSSLRQIVDSKASLLNLQMNALSREESKQPPGRIDVLGVRREKNESKQRRMVKARHFLYPQLLWHPDFY